MKMNIINRSRKNFLIETDPQSTAQLKGKVFSKRFFGVTVQRGGSNGSAFTFEKRIYNSEEVIEKFVRANTGEKITKESSLAIQKAAASDDEMILINKCALKPLTKEEVEVYKCVAANNKVDRDGERFSEDVLQSFCDSIVGKGFLFCHNKQVLPIGLCYKSAIEAGSGMTSLVIWVYILKAAEFSDELIKNIDAGIWRYCSIGFTAPAWKAITDPTTGSLLYFEYQNTDTEKAEGLEVSLVWLGAQYGAQVANGKNAETGHNKSFRNGEIMKVKVLDQEIDLNINDQMDTDQIAKTVQDAVQGVLNAKIKTLTDENATLKTAKELAEKGANIYKEQLVAEVLAEMGMAVTLDDAMKASETDRLKGMTVEQLEGEKSRWVKIVSAKSGSAKSQTEGGGENGSTKVESVSASSVQSL